jgi:hypothetical protein
VELGILIFRQTHINSGKFKWWRIHSWTFSYLCCCDMLCSLAKDGICWIQPPKLLTWLMSRHRKGIEPSWGSKNWPFYVCGTMIIYELPSGKHTKNYGKSPCLMGKSTISMAIFNSYVKLPEGKICSRLLNISGIFWNYHCGLSAKSLGNY